jgi:hypothetical protein
VSQHVETAAVLPQKQYTSQKNNIFIFIFKGLSI